MTYNVLMGMLNPTNSPTHRVSGSMVDHVVTMQNLVAGLSHTMKKTNNQILHGDLHGPPYSPTLGAEPKGKGKVIPSFPSVL